MSARTENAYVYQRRRFEGDVEFWKHGLSEACDATPVRDGIGLRLFLNTDADFKFFHNAATDRPQSIGWLSGAPEEAVDEDEEEQD